MDTSSWTFVRQGFWNALGALILGGAVALAYSYWQSRQPARPVAATQSSRPGCGY